MSELLKSCPLCGSGGLKRLYLARDPHFGIPGRHQISQCTDCSLVFMNPMYSDQELAALYPSNYYSYQSPTKAHPLKHWLKKLFGYWQGTKEPAFSRAGKFLDLGCGSGAFVDTMRRRGWTSCGVEISPQASAAGRACGIEIHCGPLEQAGFPAAHFDYVRASHSLEHMSDPNQVLRELNRILKPGGTLLVAVPNAASLNARVFREYWWHLCPPIHSFGFSRETLGGLLRQRGFEVTRVIFNSDYVGLLGSLQIWLNRKNGRRSWQGWVFNSYVLRVLAGWLQTLQDWAGAGDMIEVTAVKRAVLREGLDGDDQERVLARNRDYTAA
jgi:SAM-dependent methyltransferase